MKLYELPHRYAHRMPEDDPRIPFTVVETGEKFWLERGRFGGWDVKRDDGMPWYVHGSTEVILK